MEIDQSTLFCIVIGIVFLWFLFYASKMYSIHRIVKKAMSQEDVLSALEKTRMSGLVANYRNSLVVKTKSGNKTNIPASEFFSDQATAKTIGLNMRVLDTFSGTLVGLGLLGTFWGLSQGIKGGFGSSTEEIKQSIDRLLAGMGTAFNTSLVGMFCSLFYTLTDKLWRNRMSRRLFDLTEKLDSLYYIDDISLNTLNQQSIVDGLYSRIKEDADNTTKDHQKMIDNLYSKLHTAIEQQVNTVVTELNTKLTYTNKEGETATVGNAIREILSENTEQSKALKSFSTDLALQLNDGFDEVLSRQMQEKIVPLMENIDATTKVVVQHIDEMSANVSSPATDMIQRVVDELKKSMMSITEEFKSGLSTSATAQLETLAHQLGTAAQSMADFPKNMENISNTLQVTIEEVKNAIADITNTSANSNSTAMKQMQEQITFATTSISNAITEVKEVMSTITRNSEQSSNEMVSKLSAAADQMGQFLNGTISGLSTGMQEQISFATQSISDAVTEVKDIMSTMTKNSEQSSNEMVSKLAAAADQMGQFLNGTVSGLSSGMQDAVKSMTDDLSSKQADLIALQEDSIIQTKKLLDSFNVGLERLGRMNEYISGTMNQFQEAQGQITGSTAHLQTITNDMKIATEVFHKGQNDYSTKMLELQNVSKSNIDAITELLSNSSELSEEYVEQFETIKSGLGSIFSQLQSGLVQYSQTVQQTTQKYLDQYTASLTKSTESLSSTISMQGELVDSLVDAISKRR